MLALAVPHPKIPPPSDNRWDSISPKPDSCYTYESIDNIRDSTEAFQRVEEGLYFNKIHPADALLMRAIIYIRHRNAEKQLAIRPALEEGLKEDSVRLNPLRNYRYLWFLFNDYYQYSQYDKALQIASEAIKAAKLNNKDLHVLEIEFMVDYINAESQLYIDKKQLADKMASTLTKIEEIKPSDSKLGANSLLLGVVYVNAGDTEKSLYWFDKGINWAQQYETNDHIKDQLIGWGYANKAIAYQHLGKTVAANAAYKKWKESDFAKTPSGQETIIPFLARSKEHAHEAIKIAIQTLDLPFYKNNSVSSGPIRQFLCEAYATSGDYRNAYEQSLKLKELNDTIMHKNIEEEGQKWMKKFELQEKEYELEQKRAENRISWLVAVIALLLMTTAIGAVIWFRRTAKEMTAKNRVLVQKITTIEQYRSEVSKLRLSARQRLDSRHATDKISDEELLEKMDELTEKEGLYLKSRFTTEEMAQRLNVSMPRLQLFFKQSPDYRRLEEYFDSKRLVRACTILHDQPGLTILAVSAEAGFPTVKTFNRKFKDALGMTPSEYRSVAIRKSEAAYLTELAEKRANLHT